ncbi:MAG: hypothetical protein JRF36_10620 [Deltaproteobacteria bacterium]|jgi:hypothetical protein|nr:hypothetical protein [Deltaproteobacteria bacterium]MBW2469733.1 hypothetical protein [Deltaproteobacteria bacterium]MBW2486140.1 hypothetical protein [Deltaproteobacteria bacterium]MBW2517837.1 hypothetical protein [Deltaproteobacteria bacterium]
MKKSSMKTLKGSVFVVWVIHALIISSTFAIAGDFTMQKNMNDIAELMSKWSKQLSTGKLDADAQAKLGEIMSQMSVVLRDMTMQSQADMQMEHHNKIMEMEKTWDPFDTSDRM